jgi:hypothetical protein
VCVCVRSVVQLMVVGGEAVCVEYLF